MFLLLSLRYRISIGFECKRGGKTFGMLACNVLFSETPWRDVPGLKQAQSERQLWASTLLKKPEFGLHPSTSSG